MTEEIPNFYVGNKSKKIVCHPMINKNKEAGKPFKIKAYSQDFTWHKRQYTVETSRMITDNKGIGHIYFDVNDSAILSMDIDHEKKCIKCGGKMTIDARNFRDTVKRKTIQSLWGIDNLPMLLLIIMGIIIMVMIIAIFVLYQDNTKTHTLLQQYLPVPTKGGTK